MSVETPDNTQHYIKTGYRANRGVGGSVTQQTSRTTSVTINTLCGKIITHNASLAAEAFAEFQVFNSNVAADDIVLASQAGGAGASNATIVEVSEITNGSFKLKVMNQNPAAGAAETGAININFIVLKGTQT